MNKSYLSVIMCYVLIGASYPIVKDAMLSIPTWTFISLTLLAAFLILYPAVRLIDRVQLTGLGRMAWFSMALQALLGTVLYTVFLLYGLSSSTAVTASIFTSLAPAAVLTLSSIFLKERLSGRKILAILVAIAGILVLTLPSAESTGQDSAVGIVMLLLSTMAVAASVIAAKRFDAVLPPLTMTAGVCLIGFLYTLPMMMYEIQDFPLSKLTSSNIIVMGYYAALVWAAPYALFFYGVTRIPASCSGMAFAATPIATTLSSSTFFAVSLSTTDLIALFLVCTSIFLAETNTTQLRLNRTPKT